MVGLRVLPEDEWLEKATKENWRHFGKVLAVPIYLRLLLLLQAGELIAVVLVVGPLLKAWTTRTTPTF